MSPLSTIPFPKSLNAREKAFLAAPPVGFEKCGPGRTCAHHVATAGSHTRSRHSPFSTGSATIMPSSSLVAWSP